MDKVANPEMLILARELRGLSQSALAEASGIKQASLSKYESRMYPIPQNELNIVARTLSFPPEFFYREGKNRGPESGELFHRKKRSMTAEQLRPLHAQLNLFRLNMEVFLKAVDVEHGNSIPQHTVKEFGGSIEDIASAVRAFWGIPSGPIPNLMEVLEDAFCVIFTCDFGTDLLDEMVQWIEPMPPIILVNQQAPGDRLRFSLAHALGHLILHHNVEPYAEMEEEADQFASAFLMPAEDIVEDLKPTTLEHLGGIKPKWKVSIQALIRRAKDLGVISETRYTSLSQMISRKGYRKNEPWPISREKPTLFNRLMELYITSLQWNVNELARLLSITPPDFNKWYFSKPRHLELVIKKPSNTSGGHLSNA